MKQLLTACLLLFASATHATLISYEFDVADTTGSFSYETEHTDVRVLGLALSAFQLTWNGIEYGIEQVPFIASAWLDDAGYIDTSQISTFFGSHCMPGSCGTTITTDSWMVEVGMKIGDLIKYGSPGMESIGSGTATLRVVENVSVPEPGTLVLLSIGLLALMLKPRVKKQ